jgi:hypothetical protein
MMNNPQITIICRLAVTPEALAAIDRMAHRANSSRDNLLARFATIFALAESPPAVQLIKDLGRQVIADRRGA